MCAYCPPGERIQNISQFFDKNGEKTVKCLTCRNKDKISTEGRIRNENLITENVSLLTTCIFKNISFKDEN